MGQPPGCSHSPLDAASAGGRRPGPLRFATRQTLALLLLAAAAVWSVSSGLRDLQTGSAAAGPTGAAAPGAGAATPAGSGLAVDRPAPDFALTTLTGKPVRLADFRGQPLIINFFASWCDPCRDEAPVIRDMAAAAPANGHALLGIAMRDNRDDLTRFLASEGLALPVALDLDNRVARAYRIIGPPTTVFIDASGVVQSYHVGILTPDLVTAGLRLAGSGAESPAVGLSSAAVAKSLGLAPGNPGSPVATGAVLAPAGAVLAPAGAGLLVAAGAGVLSFASPCVFPLIPAYLGFVTGQSAQEWQGQNRNRRRRAFVRTGAFALGLITVFVALGATATALGSWLAAYRPLITRLAGVAVLAFGLQTLGWLRLSALYREFRPGLAAVSTQPNGGSAWRAMGVGAAFALGWTPCVGPLLGSVLILASQEQTLTRGMMLLLAYGLGLGIPFVAAGLVLDRLLGGMQQLRRHLGTISAISGVLLLVMGVLLAADALATVGLWLNRTNLPGFTS